MSFVKDPVREPGLPRGWRARPRSEGPHQPRTSEPREPSLTRAGEPPDAEMLEIVQTFETRYAELTPPSEARSEARVADDFVVELPDDLPPVRSAGSAATAEARPEVATKPGASTVAAMRPPSSPVQPRPSSENVSPGTRDWSTTTSRTVWPRLLAAAGVALALGTGVGYMAGKIPGSSLPGAKVQPPSEGGARLRFDYDLRTR